MKQYIKASTKYDRQSVIARLHEIPGIHIILADDYKVVFQDHNNKEYKISYSYNPEWIEELFAKLENNAKPYDFVDVSDLSKERLELIVSEIVNTMNNTAIGGNQQLIRIMKILDYYKLTR